MYGKDQHTDVIGRKIRRHSTNRGTNFSANTGQEPVQFFFVNSTFSERLVGSIMDEWDLPFINLIDRKLLHVNVGNEQFNVRLFLRSKGVSISIVVSLALENRSTLNILSNRGNLCSLAKQVQFTPMTYRKAVD
jgi:hypothetical protein